MSAILITQIHTSPQHRKKSTAIRQKQIKNFHRCFPIPYSTPVSAVQAGDGGITRESVSSGQEESLQVRCTHSAPQGSRGSFPCSAGSPALLHTLAATSTGFAGKALCPRSNSCCTAWLCEPAAPAEPHFPVPQHHLAATARKAPLQTAAGRGGPGGHSDRGCRCKQDQNRP